MPVTKSNINLDFGQGLETKTDPYQVSLGRFLDLQNSVFTKGKRLTKRNGYGALPALPDASSQFVTTFKSDLTAIGSDLKAYSSGNMAWYSHGSIQPAQLSTLPLIRNNTNQTQVDTAISSNGLICTVYTDQDPTDLTDSVYKYVIADAVTGQNIIAPTEITEADEEFGTPRVFCLGFYFIIVFTNLVTATYHLKFFAISIVNPSSVTSPADISTSYTPAGTVNFDGAVFNNRLFVAWNGDSSSGVKMAYISNTLAVSGTFIVDAGHEATLMSVCVDEDEGTIWTYYYDANTEDAYALARDQNLNSMLAATAVITNVTVDNISSVATGGVLTALYEVHNTYSYDSTLTNYIRYRTLTDGGVAGTETTVLRSVGLASKAFIFNDTIYSFVIYQSAYQSTFFLSNLEGNIVAKFAYGNAQGYLVTGLPSVSVSDTTASVGYVLKTLIQSVNKNTNVPSGSQVAGVYSQLGLNLASVSFDSSEVLTAEIGNNLNLSGGFLWGYDGYAPTEQGFFLWPDPVNVDGSASGGNITAQKYFYQVTYEWTDNQGNAFKSAPSIPIDITTTGSTSTNTVIIPTLRLTYKMANPVKIVVYRWSQAQPIYYQVTSISEPILNDPAVDSIEYDDTLADSSILGNNILYTTGGVLENIPPSAIASVFLFDNRLWAISSEDKNLLYYSKQVLQATPVEMSNLLSFYVASNIGAQGSTGPILCGSSMDDKAILFKQSAINYIAGRGPDSTGANNQYSEPIFITATVGCSNQKSIVFQPEGLMFEFASESGNQIWLLGRDLSTKYIGADVEGLTQSATVQSAVNIPGTNQVRFTLSSGITLMYDYYYGQWGTFTNVPAISSTLYQGLHTYINRFGQAFQETPGLYLDNSSPVLMAFSTAWINLAGLQGYQRAFWFTLLGTYYSPHKLNVRVAYDYAPSPSSSVLIQPNNFSPVYGADLNYGSGSPYGGPQALEQWRIFVQQQRCQSFQISVNEIYDPSLGVMAGQGLSLSGLNLVVGVKKGTRPFRAATSAGAS